MLLDEFARWLRTPRERQPIAESLAMPDGFMAAIVAGPATYEPLAWLSPAQATHRQAIPSSGGTYPDFAILLLAQEPCQRYG